MPAGAAVVPDASAGYYWAQIHWWLSTRDWCSWEADESYNTSIFYFDPIRSTPRLAGRRSGRFTKSPEFCQVLPTISGVTSPLTPALGFAIHGING